MPDPIIEPQDGDLPPTAPNDAPGEPPPPPSSAAVPPPVNTEPEVPAIGFSPVPVEVTYTKRVRGSLISALNPRNAAPSVEFSYELVRTGSDGSVEATPIPAAKIAFDPNRVIYLQSPVDDSFLGATTTWGQVFVALRSAALNEHLRRIDDPSMADKPTHAPVQP